MKREGVCSNCKATKDIELLEEERGELVYKCKNKDDPEEPGDCIEIRFACIGGCQDVNS